MSFTLADLAFLAPKAPVPVSIANIPAGTTGTPTNAASFTTPSINFVAGRHYLIAVAWNDAGAVNCTLPIALSTSSGMTFVAAACPGSDGSSYDRSGGPRRLDYFIGYCTADTSGTLTFTPNAAIHTGGFGDIEVITDEIQNAHVGSTAADCLVQAVRVDSTANATSQTTKLAAFTDATNNAGYAVSANAVDQVQTWTGPTELADLGATGGNFFGLSSAWKAGEQFSYATAWSSSSSHLVIAFEIRAARSAAPSPMVAIKAVAFSGTAGATTNTLSVPFVAGRPVIIFVNTQRVDDPRSASTVASASNTFSKISGAVINHETIASPDRRLEAWICVNPVAGTETVTITCPATMTTIDAVAIECTGSNGTIIQTATDVEDNGGTNQTLSASLAALASDSMVLMCFTADGSLGSVTANIPGDGLRRIVAAGTAGGNNYSSWPVNTIFIGVLLGRTTSPQFELKNATARNIAALALELHAA